MAESWDVFQMLPGTDAPVLLATLYESREQTIRVERDGTGTGSFAINRSSPACTEAILAQGNLVKVRIPEIHTDYLFAFFLETGDFTLVSSQEEGGEMLTFGGRGILSYLEYAKAAPHSYIEGGDNPDAGVWRAYAAGTGSKPGQILRRLLEEFQHADRGTEFWAAGSHPIPHLTIDFDYDDDSTADTWDDTDATDEFSYQVGEDGLAILIRLLETETIRVQMDPDFLLHAYNVDNFGRDLTGDAFGAGVVRFERGVNIATELRRELSAEFGVPETNMFVGGESDKYGGAELSDADERVTREAFMTAFGTGTTALAGIGLVELNRRLNTADQIMFPIANRRTSDVVLTDPVSAGSPLGLLAVDGYYLPGPAGTNGDFWVGDTVRVHTGGGPFDYNEVDAVVQAITIARDDDNAELIVIPELKTEPVIVTVSSHAVLREPSTGTGTDRDVYWVRNGDNPAPGAPFEPSAGLLHYITGGPPGGLGYHAGAVHFGFGFDGDGAVDVHIRMTITNAPFPNETTIKWCAKLDGVIVGSDEFTATVFNTAIELSLSQLAVTNGSDLWVAVYSTTGVGGAFLVPPGTGSLSNEFRVAGELTP